MDWVVLDGVLSPACDAVIPVDDPAVLLGWAVFETLASPPTPARRALHLDRLAKSAATAFVPMPDPGVLSREIDVVTEAVGGPARVRITLTRGGRRIVRGEPADPSRRHRPIRAARGPHRPDPFLGGAVKHTSRASWGVAVLRSGLDEVLLVDDAGRFTEGTTSAILAVVDGVLWTAPHDGRILESTTVTDLLDRAASIGVPVRREGPPAAGPWDGLYIASATRDLCPVVELDGEALPGWDPVGRRLADTVA
jgi:branched-subunit amino acid aminotransferase/4-amino-4-deoxychorismate lyase